MSNLLSLGVFSAVSTVGYGEDFTGSIAFTTSTGAAQTLAGIGFTLTITPTAPNSTAVWTGTTTGGQLTIGGAGNNVLSWTIAAATKAAWSGDYYLGLVGADGTNTRLIFAPPPAASLVVGGGPNNLTLTAVTVNASAGAASSWPVALSALQAQITALQAQVPAALPLESASGVPATGQAYINLSGFVVIAQ